MLRKIELTVNRTSTDEKELILSIMANTSIFYLHKSIYDKAGSTTYRVSEIDMPNINSIIGVDEYFRGRGESCLIMFKAETVTELLKMEGIYEFIKQTIDEYNSSIEEVNRLAKLYE